MRQALPDRGTGLGGGRGTQARGVRPCGVDGRRSTAATDRADREGSGEAASGDRGADSAQGQAAPDIAHLLKVSVDYVRDAIHAFNERDSTRWTQNGAGVHRARSMSLPGPGSGSSPGVTPVSSASRSPPGPSRNCATTSSRRRSCPRSVGRRYGGSCMRAARRGRPPRRGKPVTTPISASNCGASPRPGPSITAPSPTGSSTPPQVRA
jgi:hypothetical protein